MYIHHTHNLHTQSISSSLVGYMYHLLLLVQALLPKSACEHFAAKVGEHFAAKVGEHFAAKTCGHRLLLYKIFFHRLASIAAKVTVQWRHCRLAYAVP
jgi:hypothetical protein